MRRPSRKHLTIAAATAAAAVGGATVAGAADGTSSTERTAQRSSGEKPLTGTTAAKVRRAALAEVDGTVLRVETDAGGVYEAHIRKADGTEVEVKVNRAFEVTAVEEFDGERRGPHGHGPGGPADLAAVAKTLGVTEARLRSALEEARPTDAPKPPGDRATTPDREHRAEHDAREAAMYAAVARALGKDAADVKAAFEAARPTR